MAECQIFFSLKTRMSPGSGMLQPDGARQPRLFPGTARQADAEAIVDIEHQPAAVKAVDVAAAVHVGNAGQALRPGRRSAGAGRAAGGQGPDRAGAAGEQQGERQPARRLRGVRGDGRSCSSRSVLVLRMHENCERGDSNPQASRQQVLSLSCLPIPPLSQAAPSENIIIPRGCQISAAARTAGRKRPPAFDKKKAICYGRNISIFQGGCDVE